MKRLAIILLISISAVALGQNVTTTRYMCDFTSSASTLSRTFIEIVDVNQIFSCLVEEVPVRVATEEELIQLWDRHAFKHYAPKLKPPEPKELKREVK